MPRRIRVPRDQPSAPGTDAGALLDDAAGVLREGGIVAVPTETVYGLAVISGHPDALARLERLKTRSEGKPFTLHLASTEALEALVPEVPPAARRLAARYWPGPLTLVLPAPTAEAPVRTIGVRVPADELARQIIERAGAPLLVPSANPAGEPPATTADEAEAYFGDEIDLIVDGGPSTLKQSSTVVRVDGTEFHTLREGIISRSDVHQLLEGRRFLFVCTGNTCRSPVAAALYRKGLAKKLGRGLDELEELGYQIGSAGTFAGSGGRASENSITVVRERGGGDISLHRTRPATAELLAGFDRIYALGPSHLVALETLAPALSGRISPISDRGISDPVGGGLETYRRCADSIDEAIEKILARWS